jgi:hypothetical protein
MGIYSKRLSGGNGIPFTKETDSSADWSNIANNTYFRDIEDGLIYYKNSSGSILEIFADNTVPQSNIIYVDSTNGVNYTIGRGGINTPYLTPEYALSNITNTGTITGNTSTNTTISAISDVNNANLEIGMYLSGSGIPFGTIIVSKGNQGGNTNTITLSKATTATATGLTLTWWKIYEVRLSGNFIVTSNLFKEGFYINSQTARIGWGNLNLFDLTTVILNTPYLILGNGNYFGTHINSRFINGSLQVGISQLAGFVLDVNFGNIESIATINIFNLNTGVSENYVNIKGNYVNARFGTVGSFSFGMRAYLSFNSYGLLGGISGSNLVINGSISCPSAVTCLNITSSVFNGQSVGNITSTNSELIGQFSGTTITLTGGYIKPTGGASFANGSYSGATFYLSQTMQIGSNVCTFTGGVSYIYGNLNFNSTPITINTGAVLENNAIISDSWFDNSITVLGTYINRSTKYALGYGVPLSVSTGGLVINYGVLSMVIALSGVGSRLENYGTISNQISLTNDSKLINNGIINTLQSTVSINHNLSVFENYGQIIQTTTYSVYVPITKSRGKLKLYPGTSIKIANSKSPLKIGIVDSGTTTATTAFKLIQSLQNFSATVLIGDKVYNTTDSTSAKVTNIDSDTTLTLDTDIMVSGETFEIYGNPDVYYFGGVTNCDGTTYGLNISFDGIAPKPNDLVGGSIYENINY